MLVICNGMPRSASTWSFNVVTALLRAGGGSIYGAYNEDVAQFLASAEPSARHLVLKCHSLDSVGRALAASGAAKVLYTWRRLSDTVASFMRMFSVDFDHALAVTRDSLQLYEFHRRSGNAVILSYEEIIAAPADAVRRIDRYLGLDSGAETVETVRTVNTLDRMRDRADALERRENQARLIQLERTAYDPETLLNIKHIRDGGIGYGAQVLSADQLTQIKAAAREYDLAE